MKKIKELTYKYSSRHNKSCKRLAAKFAHIRDCVTLVDIHQEYLEEEGRTRQQHHNRTKYLMRCKYERLVPEMLQRFDKKYSLINAKIVKKYSVRLDEMERNSMIPPDLPKGQWKFNLKRNTKQRKKKEEDDRETN